MYRKLINALTIVVLLAGFFAVGPVSANPPAPDSFPPSGTTGDVEEPARDSSKPIDQPNWADKFRMEERQRLIEEGKYAEAAALDQKGTDRVLVLLVEFAGTDVLTWTEGVSQWDPLGIADPNEDTGVLGDCSNIITQTTVFTYTGPLHSQIERPLSAEDRSGDSIWTPDFSHEWFDGFMFGDGVVISYTRQDGSPVYEDFTGQSVADFYDDLSNGDYQIEGDIVGWIPLPHSTYWYDADQCPGARSSAERPLRGGMIDGAGDSSDMVIHAADYINAHPEEFPGFDWADYDLNGDGIIERLWIVHAGIGEEDSPTLLNRTSYGEGAVWSHSTSLSPSYEVAPGVRIKSYIQMPENGGIGVFAHEYAHNLGADDLYAYNGGETSAGFWTTMADDWTGYPIGFEPPAPDPWHLDRWGWLDPMVITDTDMVYEFTLGQASRFPNEEGMYRGARIELPDQVSELDVQPWQGTHYFWGGKWDLGNALMTTANKISIPAAATAVTLTFDMAYDIEEEWDFMWVQASEDGTTWNTLTNTNMICTHVAGWVGGANGFGDGDCGYSGYNPSFPDPDAETIDLTAFAGKQIYLRYWYMTDWGTAYAGPFIDSIKVTADGVELFADDAEAGSGKWVLSYIPVPDETSYSTNPFQLSDGLFHATHNFYLQWRNTHENGGYDSALGDTRWRFGEANTGLTMWYNNNNYLENEIRSHLTDYPSFGTKGRMLVIDSQPEPYRDPFDVFMGYNNEAGNTEARGQMRDATFTLKDTVDFVEHYAEQSPIDMEGRPAVSVFHDSLGYYPGAEFVWRGPGYTNPATAPQWVTKHWDASVVIPATAAYPMDAPGFPGGTLRFDCTQSETGTLPCYGFNLPPEFAGGNGNPAAVAAQFGWHVELVEEAADHTWAKVRVWNDMYAVDTRLTADVAAAQVGDVVEYTLKVFNPSLDAFIGACVPVDPELVEFVSSPNGIPLAECPAPEAEEAFTLEALQAQATDGPVGGIGFAGMYLHNEEEGLYTFDVKLLSADGFQPEPVQAYIFGEAIYTSQMGGMPMLYVMPEANFGLATTELKPGMPITFTNASTGTPDLSYAWDFGDGETSTEAEPVHTYALPGTYLVKLTTTNAFGEDTTEMFVTVVGLAPVAGFTASSEAVKINEMVTFTNGSMGAGDMLYLWDFGDGSTSTEANPTHAYAAAGTYTVTLQAGNAYGTSEITLEIVVTPHTVFMPLMAK